MNCEQFEARLSDYIEGELKRTDMLQMERHAAQCLACADLFAGMSQVRLAVRSLGHSEPQPGFKLQLLGNLQEELVRYSRSRMRVLAWGMAIAAALAILLWPDSGEEAPEIRGAEWMAARRAWQQTWTARLPVSTQDGPYSHARLRVVSY